MQIVYKFPIVLAGKPCRRFLGEFFRFNSHASENGLEDTIVWMTGTYDDIFLIDVTSDGIPLNAFYCVFTDSDGNEWLHALGLDYFEKIEKFEALEGHPLCIIGNYQGYSDVYEMPGCFIKSIFDQNTGNLIFSEWYQMAF